MLKFLDAYGLTPTLYIFQSSEYRTNAGGILTIIIFLFTLFASFYFGKEVIRKDSPYVNFSVETNPHPKKLKYFDEFEFIFALQDQNQRPFINQSIYFPKGRILRTEKLENKTENRYIPFEIVPCSVSPPKNPVFHTLELKSYYCISQNQSFDIDELHIVEFWGNEGFQLLQIQIFACNKGENTSNCAEDSIIDEYLNQTKISVFALDTLIQTRKFSNPFELTLKEFFLYASKNSFLSSTQYLKTLAVKSEKGILSHLEDIKMGFSLDTVQEYSISQTSKTQFINLNFQFNNIVTGYYRKYSNILDFAAQVGGIFKTLMALGYFILSAYYKNSYSECLANKFFITKEELPPIPMKKGFSFSNDSVVNNFVKSNKGINSNVNSAIKSKDTKNSMKPLSKNQSTTLCSNKRRKRWIKIPTYIKFIPIEILIKISSRNIYDSFSIAMKIIFDYLNVVNLLKIIHMSREMKEIILNKNNDIHFKNPNFKKLKDIIKNNHDILGHSFTPKEIEKKTFERNILKVPGLPLRQETSEFNTPVANSSG